MDYNNELQKVPCLAYSLESAPMLNIKSPPGERFDPVELLSAGIQVYFPLTKHLSVGILFETIGLIKVYFQQIIGKDDILLQIKVFKFKLPVALGFLFFHLCLAAFYTKTVLTLLSMLTSEITNEVQESLERMLMKLKEITNKQNTF